VKLVKREESQFVFSIGKRERELLEQVLHLYPAIPAAHFSKRHPPASKNAKDAKQDDSLLEEALAEQQRENRRSLEQMLKEPGRFAEDEAGFSFALKHGELEWLLQVLNDIRVGSWIRLGEPSENEIGALEPTEENVQLAWALEIAGLFEHTLLAAADFSEPL
jgi:hypothetical protein